MRKTDKDRSAKLGGPDAAGLETLTNVRPPKQSRSEATFSRILDAVAALLADGAYESATVQTIVSRAGCSVGAFYGRFKDKNAALFVLYDRRCDSLENDVRQILQSDGPGSRPLSAVIEDLVGVMVDSAFSGARIARASAMLSEHEGAEPFWARARSLNKRIFGWLEALLEARREEHDHPDPATASIYTIALIAGISRDALVLGSKLDVESDGPASFKAEIVRAIHGYLGVR